MLFPTLIALAAVLCCAPAVAGYIANRIHARQKQYARENHERLRTAAESWHRALLEAESAGVPACRGTADNSSLSSLDPVEGIVELS